MDPNATLARLIDAIQEGDWEEALAASQDLTDWLLCGGFMPTITADQMVILCSLTNTICQR
jgi:hypothetical protein